MRRRFSRRNRVVNNKQNMTSKPKWLTGRRPALTSRFATLASLALTAALAPMALASEDVPHRPFAQWADVPEPGQFVFGMVYEESEAYHIWASGKQYNITVKPPDGESYGIDVNQGYFALQYGITERWAADFNIGGTTAAWRTFSPTQQPESTTGLMDWSFGVRYQIFNEARDTNPAWLPTLTFRAGAVMPGSYNQNFPFAPGLRSAAIEPELLLRKHFGWPGLGATGTGCIAGIAPPAMTSTLSPSACSNRSKAGSWTPATGTCKPSRATISSTIPTIPSAIDYPRAVREINDSIEAGFSYTTSKRHIRYAFYSDTVIGGNNTDRAFWVGGSIDIPIGGKRQRAD